MDRDLMGLYVLLGLVAICLTVIGVVSDPEPSPCTTYHEMRAIYEQSQGEFGWPRGAIKECER